MLVNSRLAVILPCYRSKGQVLGVIDKIGPEVSNIVVVDDKCPEMTGDYVAKSVSDDRVIVLYHEENQGVGGALITGYRHALGLDADIVVKLDSDGQMDPALIRTLIAPIVNGVADYSKGNRFFNPHDASAMPRARLFGNLALSFLTKLSSGYWQVFDPTNGFTAIHKSCLEILPLHKINRRFFFESDMLYHLYLARSVVVDVPMTAQYGEENSNLKIGSVLVEFSLKHCRNIIKRILYSYFLRDFSIASVNLVFGCVLLVFGLLYGGIGWYASAESGQAATAGTVMVGALPIIIGVQFLVSFLGYDYSAVPRIPIQQLTRLP
ncbi:MULTISPECIES: glycosyltransferase family 2 protein [unclassified Mesorhizobium]|uniref:glycosyltransferase family 2 protein n=1 Tax=unclassified Mesorhizobium TaxID=325217 RepID=UPI000BAEA674|nr:MULTISPECIES: glycosyltransferase family 2 protein [unclassified Mesorhizobium]PBC23463.1 glycosyl transferase family 2 [Mesorhizobium sp. WSM4311]TRD06828.1 glycosyltransferase family 2 protein [Mesorhizobium sp. WSM4305]